MLNKKKICFFFLFLIPLLYLVSCDNNESNIQTKSPDPDKSAEIASFIQSKINTGGYKGCIAKSIGYKIVKVDLRFPAGTRRYDVEINVQKVADLFAQSIRFDSTIIYAGYSGQQKICQYQYDPYQAKVEKID